MIFIISLGSSIDLLVSISNTFENHCSKLTMYYYAAHNIQIEIPYNYTYYKNFSGKHNLTTQLPILFVNCEKNDIRNTEYAYPASFELTQPFSLEEGKINFFGCY